jgi:hypothetical protein
MPHEAERLLVQSLIPLPLCGHVKKKKKKKRQGSKFIFIYFIYSIWKKGLQQNENQEGWPGSQPQAQIEL